MLISLLGLLTKLRVPVLRVVEGFLTKVRQGPAGPCQNFLEPISDQHLLSLCLHLFKNVEKVERAQIGQLAQW